MASLDEKFLDYFDSDLNQILGLLTATALRSRFVAGFDRFVSCTAFKIFVVSADLSLNVVCSNAAALEFVVEDPCRAAADIHSVSDLDVSTAAKV